MKSFVNIIDFAESAEGLNLSLFPAQKFLLKGMYGITFDNIERVIKIGDWDEEAGLVSEEEYQRILIDEGRFNAGEDPSKGGPAVLCLGRRSGKTLLICIILLWELYQLLSKGSPHKHYGMNERDLIQLTVVSSPNAQAAFSQSALCDLMNKSGLFKPFFMAEKGGSLTFASPARLEEGGAANIRILFQGEQTVRGVANYMVMFDEVAYFQNPNKIYHAITPSVSLFTTMNGETGRIVMISTPHPKGGFFEDHFYSGLMGNGSRYTFVYQAPTWEVNSAIPSRVYTQCVMTQDMETVLCEIGGMFSSQRRNWDTIRKLRDVLSELPRIAAEDRKYLLKEMRARLRPTR